MTRQPPLRTSWGRRHVLVLGYLAAVSVIGSAAVVGRASALNAVLFSIGAPKDSAIQYKRGVKGGSFLVVAPGTTKVIALAHAVLTAASPAHLQIHPVEMANGSPTRHILMRAQEDRRRIRRQRRSLVAERVENSNRIKGLLFAQGNVDCEPLRFSRRVQPEELQTGDGWPFRAHLKDQVIRALDRPEIILTQLKSVEAERDALLAEASDEGAALALLSLLKGIGPQFANVLWSEGLHRHFDNRRQVAANAGL